LENHQKVTDYSLYFESEHINVSPYLECNYVFLDTQERTYFAQHSLDYLIERVQRIPFYGVNTFNALDLTLQHPVKEIIWVIKRNDTKDTNKWFDFGDSTDEGKKVEVLKKAKITFNGLDRFEAKDPQYFNVIQPYQHHTVVPKEGVYVYSFSLFPEKFQPSGACNMSRIKNIQLHLELASPLRDDYKYDVFVYVTSYNFLRIASGMAGIAFAC
jgi:hypothetical protein